MVSPDPLDRLQGVGPGMRLSLRLDTGSGLADRLGLLLELTDRQLVIEDRHGVRHTIERATIRLARRIPTVPRGRNPLAFDPGGPTALAHDPWLGGRGRCWVARLSELVDHLDDTGVRPGGPDRAGHGASRALVTGEWVGVRLAHRADLEPLAAWAARRNARNIALTSELPAADLQALGLTPID